MKQLIFMIAALFAGTVGAVYHPFWGVLVYYGFAVLRPQYLWEWSLPQGWRWSLMAAGVVVLGVVSNLPRVLLGGRFNLIAMLMILYVTLVMFGVLTAYNPTISQVWAEEYAKILLIAIIATFVVDSMRHLEILATMILLCVGYIAWTVNSLYIFDGRLDVYHYGFGGLDNNGAGLILAMGIPFAWVFGAAAEKKWLKFSCWFLGVVMLHAMLMTYSRGAMVTTLIAVAWLLYQHRPRKHAVALLACICVIVPMLAGKEIRNRFFSTGNMETDPSIHSRFDSWQAAWEIIADHPLTGTGIRNSNLFSHAYGADVAGRTIHNQYLQIAADSGLPAMGCYTLMLVLSLTRFSAARKMCNDALEYADGRADEEACRRIGRFNHILLGCQASLLIFAVGAMFLSLEVFELPWVLAVMAGVAPIVLREELPRILGISHEEFTGNTRDVVVTYLPPSRAGTPARNARHGAIA